jgi:tetratricopeptide (TPR) repeat protein
MKKRTRFLFLTTTLVFGSVVGSYFMLPSNQQMALNNYKDKNYAEALAIYEKQLADDNLSVDTVSTLTKVYLQYAKIDEAISVMEKFVAQNPSNLEARQELGSLYQYGQRTDDYV